MTPAAAILVFLVAAQQFEEERPAGARPAGWDRAVSDLAKAIDDARPTAEAARRVAGYDSAEGATKLISAYLRCVKLLEACESQDQKITRQFDEALSRFAQGYMQSPRSAETQARARQAQQLLGDVDAVTILLQRYEEVLGGVLDALGTLRSAEAAQAALKQAQGVTSLRYRARLIEAIGSFRTATAQAGIVEILKKSTNDIETLAAVRAIGVQTPEAADALTVLLVSGQWQVRTSAARALAEMGARDRVGVIIEALKTSRGQPGADLNDSLKKLTGVDKHGSPDAWLEWWEKNREPFLAGTYKPEAIEKAGQEGSTTFFGVPVVSHAVAFVIDVSGSMSEPCAWRPEEGEASGVKLKGGLRIDVVKYELKKVILRLPENATVCLIFYDGNIRLYGGGPVKLTAGKRKSIVEFVDGVGLGGLTNLSGALFKALSYAGDATVPSLKKDGIDTIYALTDGVPTVGVTDTAKLISRFRRTNGYTQVRVHSVQIGVDAAAQKLLEGLAQDNRGIYQSR